MTIYYTWLDIKRELDLLYMNRYRDREILWPEYWKRVDCYHDEIVVTLDRPVNDELIEESSRVLGKLFGHHYSSIDRAILLDYNKQKLVISYDFDESNMKAPHRVIPLFRSLNRTGNPPEKLNGVPVVAFHSYKGGVGRTLSLLAFARAFSNRDSNNSGRLLIVDGDLEAPGLSWMANHLSGMESEVNFSDISFLDALSILHCSENWQESALPYIANKVRERTLRLPLAERFVEHYFLPAYRYIEQILQIPDMPVKVISTREREWIIADFLSALGAELGAEAVIVDLRAGFSEISSPLLFDPRVNKIFVTSTSLQSRKGIISVLKQVYPEWGNYGDADYTRPKVLITMVQEGVDTTGIKKEIVEALSPIYNQQSNDDVTMADISSDRIIEEIPFSSALVHLDGFDSIEIKLSNSQTGDIFARLVNDWFPSEKSSNTSSSGEQMDRTVFLQKLEHVAKKMATAESSDIFEFLATSPLRNLAQKYRVNVPSTVILGAKGSGKTFAFLQLLYSEYWESFLTKINKNEGRNIPVTHIIPFIRSKTLNESTALEKIRGRILSVNSDVGFQMDTQSIVANLKICDEIEEAINNNLSESEWRHFWIKSLLASTGLPFDSLIDLNQYLVERGRRIVFMIDGLEEIFKDVAKSATQKNAITALSQGVIAELRSILDNRVGLLLFLRRDIALNSIEQNWTQFYNSYSPYELKWSKTETLLLVLWLCRIVDRDFIEENEGPIENWTYEMLEQKLYKLWGIKLGGPKSREAYTAKWVLSALADLNDQLQARDMIRFLGNAANGSLRATSPLQDRYLAPEAIRKAITPCSVEKIKELQQEIPNLEPIFQKLRADREVKQIPFDIKDYNLENDEVRLLEQQGFLIEYGSEGYYMPEIIRLGLGFKLEKGARPKVVALLNRAKSRI
jgi:hypothetical protein